MKNMSVALALVLGFASAAYAQDTTSTTTEGQTKMTVEEAKDSKNKVSGDLDTEITNAKLRAESGSKSRWSGSFSGSYYGGSLETPFSKYRANTSQETTPPRVNLSGDISARMRIDKNQSITLGAGVSIQDPIHEAKKGDIDDPYVNYNYAGKVGKVQSIFSGLIGAPTNHDELTLGTLGFAVVDQTFMYDFNGSKASVGIVGEVVYQLYKDNKNVTISYRTEPDDTFKAGTQQRDYSVAAYPMAEYAFTDAISLRTVFRPWNFDHSVMRAGDTFSKRRWTQSLGLGWAATRDIYLYPNFQWDVEQWRGKNYSFADKAVRANTTVALTATVNVF